MKDVTLKNNKEERRMKMDKEKYNNQNPQDIPKDEKILNEAILSWSEGNRYLEKLIRTSIKNNIKTFACCAGHEGKTSHPYISFKADEKSLEILFDVFKTMYEDLDEIFSVSFSFDKEYNTIITITLNYENRNEKFEKITSIIVGDIKYIKNVESEEEKKYKEEIDTIIKIYDAITKKRIKTFMSFGDIKNTGKNGIYIHFNERNNIIEPIIKEMFEFQSKADIPEHNFYQIVYYLDDYSIEDLKILLEKIENR